jgi:hypothetical protein
MLLTQVEPKTILNRIRRFILGRQRPDFLTRMSFLGGLIVWVYLASWQALTLMAIMLKGTLKPYNSDGVENALRTIMHKYNFEGTEPWNFLVVHSALQLLVYAAMLVGLIFIYRRMRTGFLLYVASAVGTFVVTFIIMGPTYMIAEFSYVDFALLAMSALYFAIILVVFYPKSGIRRILS